MTRAIAAILGTALLAGAVSAQQENKIDLSLAAKVPNPRAKRPLLQCDGQVPLPDMSVLFVSVARSYEVWAGGRLEPAQAGAGGLMAQVRERKFSLGNPIDGPGLFDVRVDFREELQNPKIMEFLKKTPVQPRSWNFKFSAWNDELVKALVSNLQELDSLAQEAGEMVKKFEQACAKEEVWKSTAKEITDENSKLLKRCEQSGLKALYPAALTQIHYSIRNLQGNSPYFSFDAGKFAGATSYHADNQKLKTFREEDFTFENFKRYCQEASSVAGREFSLWIVKDFRRNNNQLSADASEAVKEMKQHPGISDFVERLLALKAEEVALLETDIRAAKLAPGQPPKTAPK
jgi:hypothetical protein